MASYRLFGFVALAVFVNLLTGFHTQEASANPDPAPNPVPATSPFKWQQYKGADGKMYDFPSWKAVQGQQGKVNLDAASGVVYPPANYKVTKAVMKIYKPSATAPGSYETTPALTLESNNPLALVPAGYQVAWGENPPGPYVVFDAGVTVKIEIRVSYQNVNNANDKFEADLSTQYAVTTVH